MPVRGIRGAINVAENSREEIFSKTRELLEAMIRANRVRADDVAAAFFTMTPDLNADFPAYVARDLGWKTVPMMCASELGVPGGMKKVVRIMLLVNTKVPPGKIRHQYLGDTPCLRPDLAKTDGQKAPPKRQRTKP
jgi:chorismate mutase